MVILLSHILFNLTNLTLACRDCLCACARDRLRLRPRERRGAPLDGLDPPRGALLAREVEKRLPPRLLLGLLRHVGPGTES